MNSMELQLRELAKCMDRQKIKYAVLGGIAVSIYGEPRLTADIDVNILFEKKKIDEFLEAAKTYGFQPAFPNIEKIVKETGVVPMSFKKKGTIGKFDIIIAGNTLEYAAIERSISKKIGSVMVRLVSPEDLLIHKIASDRPRDLEDVSGILIRQRGRLDMRYIGLWLARIDKANKTQLRKTFRRVLKSLK